MPTYLVAVDFSECSHLVLEQAIQRCRSDGARMVLLHGYRPGIKLGSVYHDGALDPIRELEAEMQLDEAVELSTKWARRAREADIDVEVMAESEDPAHLIIDTAKSTGADMIIMGRSGHGILHQLFVGSTADYVIRHAKVPVLVVPEVRS